MTLQSFLEHLSSKKQLPDLSVICFYSKEYPLLFFSHIVSFLQKHTNNTKTFDVVGIDLLLIKAHISTMSFSGQTVYWLHGIHELSPKKQQEWIAYAQTYSGPHVIVFFSTDESVVALQKLSQGICIALPEHVPANDFSLIRFLVTDGTSKSNVSFSSRLLPYTQQLSLDSACLFAHYELVVGKSIDDFFKEWAGHIIEPTHSLFLLSQYFFGKKSKLFFQQWSYSTELYLPPFWVTFWADQLWRAYIYCELMQQKKYAEAKKVQYKLPFSLINRDWSSLKLSELRNAHQFLSTMDFRLKNGGSSVALELFYGMFFENKFR